jgi:hypothetical protein
MEKMHEDQWNSQWVALYFLNLIKFYMKNILDVVWSSKYCNLSFMYFFVILFYFVNTERTFSLKLGHLDYLGWFEFSPFAPLGISIESIV